MRQGLGVLATLTLLFFSGCTPNESDIGPGGGNSSAYQGVSILSPEPGQRYERHYRWVHGDSTDPCDWYWQRIDTLELTAWATADVPGGVQSAQVYFAGSNGSMSHSGPELHPGPGAFGFPYYTEYYNTPPYSSYTRTYTFCVRVLTGDGAYWISPAVSFQIATVFDSLPALPPPTPLPLMFTETTTSDFPPRGSNLTFTWCTQLPHVTTYFSFWNSFDNAVRIDTVVADDWESFWFYDYLPLTTYGVSLVNVNEFGASPPSDTLWLDTAPPVTAYYLQASIRLPQGDVHLTWNPARTGDSLLVARRDADGPWQTLHRYNTRSGGYYTGYTDTTAVSGGEYYYRLGSLFRNGTFWSAESLHVRLG